MSSDRAALQTAVFAHLGRYRGATRQHTESDLRIVLTWCTDKKLDPLTARRFDIERYVSWLQDVRCYQPSTVSRRLFEALITTAHLSAYPDDIALIAMLGLLGLRIFEARGASISDLGEEHGHRVLRIDGCDVGPIPRNTLGARMDRGRGPPCATTVPARPSIAIPTTSSPRTWPPEPSGPPGAKVIRHLEAQDLAAPSRHGGLRLLSTAWTLLGRGIGANGAVVPRDSSGGGQGHEAFTDGTQTPLALSHLASPVRPLHVISLDR